MREPSNSVVLTGGFAAVIVGVFALIVVIAAKKTGEKAAAAENALRQEDKEWLRTTEYQSAPEVSDIAVYAPAIIVSVKERGKGAALYLLFWNTYFPNSGEGMISPADINISAKEYQAHPVKAGDRVRIVLNGDKSARIAWGYS